MGQPKRLRTVELDLQQLVRVCRPSARWGGIAWGVGVHIDKAAVVRAGDVHGEAPVELQKAGLRGVRQPDFHDSVVTVRDRRRVARVGPDEHFIAVLVARNVLVTIGMAHLTQKSHLDIEQFLAGVAHVPRRVPAHDHIVVGRYVQAVEGSVAGVEYRELRVLGDLVDEDEFVVSGEDEVVPIQRDVRLAHAADGGVFAESV